MEGKSQVAEVSPQTEASTHCRASISWTGSYPTTGGGPTIPFRVKPVDRSREPDKCQGRVCGMRWYELGHVGGRGPNMVYRDLVMSTVRVSERE